MKKSDLVDAIKLKVLYRNSACGGFLRQGKVFRQKSDLCNKNYNVQDSYREFFIFELLKNLIRAGKHKTFDGYKDQKCI